MKTPNPCKECKSSNTEIDSGTNSTLPEKCRIRCESCGKKGKPGKDLSEAISNWNREN